jgi:hypothetical protein
MPTHDDKDPPQSTAELYRVPPQTHEVLHVVHGLGVIADCLGCGALILRANAYGDRLRDYCGRCQPV